MKLASLHEIFSAPFWSAWILFASALCARLVLSGVYRFDGLYGQDAYAYYQYARQLFDALTRLQAPPPFWWSLGYPLLLNVGFLFGGQNIAAAQSITLVCGALIPSFAFLLAYEAAHENYKLFAAWTTGLLCLAGGQLAQSSVVIMADAPALMFATLAAWLLLRYARTRVVLTLAFAALAVGLAVWLRWQNLIFAGAWFVTLLWIEWHARVHSRKQSVLRMLLASSIIALVLLPQLLIQTTTSAQFAGQSWLENWSVANSFARAFDNVDGHFEYALPVAIFYGHVFAHPAYLLIMLTPLFILGIFVLKNRIALLLLGGWILGMYLFLAGIPYENFRFGLGMFVPIAALAGIGAGALWQSWRASRRRFVLLGWLGVALSVMFFWQPRVLAPVLEIKARELQHIAFLQKELVPNALVYTMSIDGALQTYSELQTKNLWQMNPQTLDEPVPTYLYVDTNNIDSQWRGRLPDQLLRALIETNYLHPLASFQGWTLYRVRNCKYRIMDCE